MDLAAVVVVDEGQVMALLAALRNIVCLGLFTDQQMGNKPGPCSREVLGEPRARGKRFCQNAMSAWYVHGMDLHAMPLRSHSRGTEFILKEWE